MTSELTDAERELLAGPRWTDDAPGPHLDLFTTVEHIVTGRTRAVREQGRAEGDAEWAAAVEGWLAKYDRLGNIETRPSILVLRALLTADRTKALDAVKAQAAREAGERIAQAIEATRVDGSREWGHACNAAARIARADRNPNGGA